MLITPDVWLRKVLPNKLGAGPVDKCLWCRYVEGFSAKPLRFQSKAASERRIVDVDERPERFEALLLIGCYSWQNIRLTIAIPDQRKTQAYGIATREPMEGAADLLADLLR